MGMRDVYAELKAGVEKTMRDLGQKVPSFAFGDAGVAALGGPRRVGFIPRSGGVKQADRSGGTTSPLWKRQTQVELHCWSDDAEALAGHVVAALDVDHHGHYRVEGERWDTAGTTQKGELLVVLVSIDTEWLREPIRTGQATTKVITPTVEASA